MEVIAKAGERVMDSATGKVICRVKSDLLEGDRLTVESFADFAEGEPEWHAGERLDPRCFLHPGHPAGTKIFVEGEWRP